MHTQQPSRGSEAQHDHAALIERLRCEHGRAQELTQQITGLQDLIQEKNDEIMALRRQSMLLTEKSAGDEETIGALIKQLEGMHSSREDPAGNTARSQPSRGDSALVNGSAVSGRTASVQASGTALGSSDNAAAYESRISALSAQLASSTAAITSKNDEIVKLESHVRELMEVNAFYTAIVNQHDEEEKQKNIKISVTTNDNDDTSSLSAASPSLSQADAAQRIAFLGDQQEKLQRVVKQTEHEKRAILEEVETLRKEAARLEEEMAAMNEWYRGLQRQQQQQQQVVSGSGGRSAGVAAMVTSTSAIASASVAHAMESEQGPTAPNPRTIPERVPAQIMLLRSSPAYSAAAVTGSGLLQKPQMVMSPLAAQSQSPILQLQQQQQQRRRGGSRVGSVQQSQPPVNIHSLRPIHIRNPNAQERELLERLRVYEGHIAQLEAYESDRQRNFEEMERTRAELFTSMNEQLEKQRKEVMRLRKLVDNSVCGAGSSLASSSWSPPASQLPSLQQSPVASCREEARGSQQPLTNVPMEDVGTNTEVTSATVRDSSPVDTVLVLLMCEETEARRRLEGDRASVMISILSSLHHTVPFSSTEQMQQFASCADTMKLKVPCDADATCGARVMTLAAAALNGAGDIHGESNNNSAEAASAVMRAVLPSLDAYLDEKKWATVEHIMTLNSECMNVCSELLRDCDSCNTLALCHRVESLREQNRVDLHRVQVSLLVMKQQLQVQPLHHQATLFQSDAVSTASDTRQHPCDDVSSFYSRDSCTATTVKPTEEANTQKEVPMSCTVLEMVESRTPEHSKSGCEEREDVEDEDERRTMPLQRSAETHGIHSRALDAEAVIHHASTNSTDIADGNDAGAQSGDDDDSATASPFGEEEAGESENMMEDQGHQPVEVEQREESVIDQHGESPCPQQSLSEDEDEEEADDDERLSISPEEEAGFLAELERQMGPLATNKSNGDDEDDSAADQKTTCTIEKEDEEWCGSESARWTTGDENKTATLTEVTMAYYTPMSEGTSDVPTVITASVMMGANDDEAHSTATQNEVSQLSAQEPAPSTAFPTSVPMSQASFGVAPAAGPPAEDLLSDFFTSQATTTPPPVPRALASPRSILSAEVHLQKQEKEASLISQRTDSVSCSESWMHSIPHSPSFEMAGVAAARAAQVSHGNCSSMTEEDALSAQRRPPSGASPMPTVTLTTMDSSPLPLRTQPPVKENATIAGDDDTSDDFEADFDPFA